MSELEENKEENFELLRELKIRAFLSIYWVRMPKYLSDLYKTLNYEMTGGILKDFLDKCDIYHFSEIVGDSSALSSDFQKEMPQYFLTEIEDKIILVDTQGFHYIRYALVLDNYPIKIIKTYKKWVNWE